MRPKELQALIASARKFDKAVKRDHGFQAEYYLIESLDLVLVVNPANSVIVTVYSN